MWIIKNNTLGTVLIDDLGICLSGHQEFDLDLLGREKAESSVHLAVLLNKGIVSNVHKEEATDKVNSDKSFIAEIVDNVTKKVLQELRGEMAEDSLKSALTLISNALNQNAVSTSDTDDFEDVSIYEVQASMVNDDGDKLSPNFKHIGHKEELNSSNDIVDKLRDIKRLKDK